MSERQIAHDLGRALQHDIGELIKRRLKIARPVVETGQLGVMMIEAAVSVALTTAATIAATSKPECQAEMVDYVLSAITKSITGDRERIVAAVKRGGGEEL